LKNEGITSVPQWVESNPTPKDEDDEVETETEKPPSR